VAAAAVGRLVSLPRALIGGLGLGVFISLFNTFLPEWSDTLTWLRPIQDNITPAVPFLLLFAIFVFWPAIRKAPTASDPMAGVDPPPPVDAATARSQLLTRATRIFGVVFLVTLFSVVFLRADQFWLFLVTQGVVLGIIFLSITVITGFAGQISLCQGAFAAIGGFTVFQMASRYGMSVLLAAVIGACLAALVGALLAYPVRRLGGVWLAIATLAFAFFFDAVVVKLSWVGGGETSLLQGTRVPRPTLGPLDFANDKTFLALCIVVFAVVAVLVINLRGGTFGRTLRAVQGSEVAAESIGIAPARARIVAFAVSAFIAGLGGGLLSIAQENVNYANNFAPVPALFWLVLVVSLSSRTVTGAAQAGAVFMLFDAVILKGAFLGWILGAESRIPGLFPIDPQWRFVLFGLTAMQYARHPEGMLEYGTRRTTARIDAWLARRRGHHDDEPDPAVGESSVDVVERPAEVPR
jgi:branched-chain amino acid transport system permease protein